MAAAPISSSPSWADLNSELLVSIAAAADNGLSLRDYQCLRGVCSAWRSVLAPPYPCLLSLADGGGRSASVFSLPMRQSFNLCTASEAFDDICREGRDRNGSRVRAIGSGNGRLAVAVDHGNLRYDMPGLVTISGWRTVRILLLDPHRRCEYGELPPPPTSMHDYKCVLKVVFRPDAGRGTVVATCNSSKVSYIDTGSANMVWTTVDVVKGDLGHLTDMAFDAGGGKLYCLDSRGAVHVLGIPHNCQAPVANVPRLLTRLPAAFPAPYVDVFTLTRTKHLFFCHGSLHQIWQNTIAAVKLPSGFRIPMDEIHVVRYDPGLWPAWEVVKDLGGSSVFIGENSNPVVVRAAGAGAVPGVRPNCVYWINRQRVPMVCDVATGASVPFVTPSSNGVCNGDCWYFDDDSTRNNCDEPGAPIARSIILHLQATNRELRTSLLF